MTDLKKKLEFLDRSSSGKITGTGDSRDNLSTKHKLEELINKNLRSTSLNIKKPAPVEKTCFQNDFELLYYSYPLDAVFGKVALKEWADVKGETISVIFKDPAFRNIDPGKLLYFDTETTGLSGGTGTIPFMLGFGFIESNSFEVRIFVLNDPGKEEIFLDNVDQFLSGLDISGVVTYNGKGFDFPLVETRYILNRRKFPLLNFPHLDYLFPARIIWKNTFESRKLGYLGDILLNISRDDDIDGSLIPQLYFEYLRTGDFSMIEKVVEHNALDIVGLSSLLLLGCRYADDFSLTSDEGEILGIAFLNERSGGIEAAEKIYKYLKEYADRDEIILQSVKKLAGIKKKRKLFEEAEELWKILSSSGDKIALKEMSIYLEHRKKDFSGALEFVMKGLEQSCISGLQREDFERRLVRLKKKISRITEQE